MRLQKTLPLLVPHAAVLAVLSAKIEFRFVCSCGDAVFLHNRHPGAHLHLAAKRNVLMATEAVPNCVCGFAVNVSVAQPQTRRRRSAGGQAWRGSPSWGLILVVPGRGPRFRR